MAGPQTYSMINFRIHKESLSLSKLRVVANDNFTKVYLIQAATLSCLAREKMSCATQLQEVNNFHLAFVVNC